MQWGWSAQGDAEVPGARHWAARATFLLESKSRAEAARWAAASPYATAALWMLCVCSPEFGRSWPGSRRACRAAQRRAGAAGCAGAVAGCWGSRAEPSLQLRCLHHILSTRAPGSASLSPLPVPTRGAGSIPPCQRGGWESVHGPGSSAGSGSCRKRLRFARLICTPASPGTPGPALLRGWHKAVLVGGGPGGGSE